MKGRVFFHALNRGRGLRYTTVPARTGKNKCRLVGTVPTKDSNTNIFNKKILNKLDLIVLAIIQALFVIVHFDLEYFIFTNWKLVPTSAQTIVK
jgi:hypothetical protein